jgi:hypothetical protein
MGQIGANVARSGLEVRIGNEVVCSLPPGYPRRLITPFFGSALPPGMEPAVTFASVHRREGFLTSLFTSDVHSVPMLFLQLVGFVIAGLLSFSASTEFSQR